jgi:hypothetical protein
MHRAPEYDREMALISLDRWLDRFGYDRFLVGVLPARLTFAVHAERRTAAQDRRVRNQPPPGVESRRTGLGPRRR